jgi:VacB/RNase II family 3'-5' exoribonuclease
MNATTASHRARLEQIAYRAMQERGLWPDFSSQALSELANLQSPVASKTHNTRDLKMLLWCSIDNDDSQDLDQLTVAEQLPNGGVKVFVAIADVDALVKPGTALDTHAQHNTTSVYTAARIFPMLPEQLSTDRTSLKFQSDRLALIVEMSFDATGHLTGSNLYQAWVHNHAKLAYNGVAAWLDGIGPMPAPLAAVPGLDANLRLQDAAAQRMHALRHEQGALSLESREAKPVFEADTLLNLEIDEKNRAKALIEDFMIAANGVTARFLAAKAYPSLRRVVREPKRWDRIIEVAKEHQFRLPPMPDAKALEEFLIQAKRADPIRFPDLSLTIVKLMGPGEYIADAPAETAPGHFGLAVKDYAHSTAPNRRFPDILTQRLLKAALDGRPSPYSMNQLADLAAHCTEEEDAANKVERQVAKSAAALLLQSRIGQSFDGIVTGAADKGTWVRLLDIPAEGRVVSGMAGLDVGDRVHVQLLEVNVERGFIDFKAMR